MGSGSGGGKGSDTVTTVNQPWDRQAPYLTFGFNRAQNLYNTGGPEYYKGQNYVGMSNRTDHALDDMWYRANKGSPVMDRADTLATRTMRGDFLRPESNPYLGKYFQSAVDQALPGVNATFSAAGRTGADAQSQAIGDTMGRISRDIYGGAYENERGRQMAAMGMAPTLANQDYVDLNAALQASQGAERYTAEKLRGDMERFNFNENRPFDNLERYMRAIQGNYGGTSTQNQPTAGGNPLMGALGGGIGGAGLASMLGLSGPVGWGLAGLGGLAGLFG